MAKSTEMKRAMETLAEELFGQDVSFDAGNKCFCCGVAVNGQGDFRDPLSWKEFGISRMCQVCQDKVWK